MERGDAGMERRDAGMEGRDAGMERRDAGIPNVPAGGSSGCWRLLSGFGRTLVLSFKGEFAQHL